MREVVAGLTPLDPDQLVTYSLEELREMKVPELVAVAHQIGINVHRIQAERGKLLTEIMNRAHDA